MHRWPTELGRRLRKTREARGLSQREVARRANLTNTVVARIESGATPSPGVETIWKLETALGEPGACLLCGCVKRR
jgi:transcriptional regulator with XRE-family HTH domain